MQKMIVILAMLFLACLALAAQNPAADSSASRRDTLAAFLKTRWAPPEDYVVSKFGDHDIVFVGESHRIKHDVELIQALIPRLYQAGIHNLGMEFGDYEYQDKADKLVTAEAYDEDLARWLMFKNDAYWGYEEYMDLYRVAWRLNKGLPKNAPRFRVVGLNYTPHWKLMTVPLGQLDEEQRQKVFYKGDIDVYMADVILKEFVAKDQKALVYSGAHHAFTRYRQPSYDFEKKKANGFRNKRMGNLIYDRIGARAFNVFLHSPWLTKESPDEMACPAGGVIDALMMGFADKRVGFDVAGTPFGKLRDPNTYYAIGHEDFKLEDFCDGYIYQRLFKDYEGVTTDPLFITPSNFQEAVDNSLNLEAKRLYSKPQDIIETMKRTAGEFPRLLREYVRCPGQEAARPPQ